jgi:hypothetical protein
VVGTPAPSAARVALKAKVPEANRIEVAIDASGSMQGLIGSPEATSNWSALLRGVSLAGVKIGKPIQAMRVGSGQLQILENVSKGGDPCFFSGCGSYTPVTTSLDTLWKEGLSEDPDVPLKVMISDLEVDKGEITGLVAAIKPHVAKGGVIGVLAMKLPFEGSVFNSRAEVVHTGESLRPIYLLATGPQAQLKVFLNEVRTQAGLAGVPTNTMKLTLLDEHVNRPTLQAASTQGVPPLAIKSDLQIRLAGNTYSPSGQSDYQFVKLLPNAEGVRMSSGPRVGHSQDTLPDIAVVQIEPVAILDAPPALGSGVTFKGLELQDQTLQIDLAVPGSPAAGAIRATIPRGRLPEDWWINWDRRDPSSSSAKEQTDGLLPLLTNLGSLLVEPGSTPAAAFCLAFSH